MSKRWESYRYRKLSRWGFAPWEAKKLSHHRITDPAVKALVRERKQVMREARRAKISKTRIYSQMSALYKAEGITTKKAGFDAGRLLESYRQKPEVQATIQRYQVSQQRVALIETGYKDRYRTLRKAGFTTGEAKQLARMKEIDTNKRAATFKSAPWQLMIDRHQGRIKARVKRIMKAGGLSWGQALKEYNRQINKKIGQKRHSPWDWIKIEYRPVRRVRDYIVYETKADFKKAKAKEDLLKAKAA